MKRQLAKPLLSLLLSCSLSSLAVADSLKNEIGKFIDNHPKVNTAKQQLINSGIDIEVAKANYMPVLNVNGDVGSQDFEDTYLNVDNNLENNRYMVEISQNLFRGYRDKAAIDESMVKEKIAIKTYENIKQSITLEATNAYLDVLHYHLSDSKVSKKVEILNKLVGLIEKAKRSGSRTDVDIYEAQLTAQQALEQQIDIQGKQQSALGQFQSIFGYQPNVNDFTMPSYRASQLPGSLEDALETAKNQSVVITIAQSNIEKAGFNKDAVSGEYWPTVDLVTSYSEEKNKEGTEGRTKDGRIYLRMEWKYNLGNQINKKVRSAEGYVVSEKYNYDAIVKEVEQNVRLAWQKYSTLQRRHQLAKDTLGIAQSVYKARLDLKSRGKGNNMAIINANIRLIDSEIAMINAEFESIKSVYNLSKELGTIETITQ